LRLGSLDTKSTALATVVAVVDVVSVSNGNELIVGEVPNNVDVGSTMDTVGPPMTGVGSAGQGLDIP